MENDRSKLSAEEYFRKMEVAKAKDAKKQLKRDAKNKQLQAQNFAKQREQLARLLRQINDHPAFGWGIVGALLLLAALPPLVLMLMAEKERTTKLIWDLQANHFVQVDMTAATDGAPGAAAKVFSCGECGEIEAGMTEQELKDAGMFIGYLVVTRKAAGGATEQFYVDPAASQELIPAKSPQVRDLVNAPRKACNNKRPQSCSY